MLKERHMIRETEEQVKEPVSFWSDKKPCWEMCHCPDDLKHRCPAPKYPFVACWELEGTYLKLSDNGDRGDNVNICRVCRVYKRYGEGKPIKIKLRGKGLDSYCRYVKEICKAY